MHTGKTVRGETKPSKTECIFFPLPQFFANLNPLLENSIVIENVIAEDGASSKDQDDALQEAREIARTAQEDDLYDQLDKTQSIPVTETSRAVISPILFIKSASLAAPNPIL